MSLPVQPERALLRWTVAQALLWLPALLIVAWSLPARFDPKASNPLASSELLLAWMLLALQILSYGGLWIVLHAGRTLADWVTLMRFVGLTVFCLLAISAGTVTPALWTAALLIVLSDLLDGLVARRFGSSEAGASLDMETDQATTLWLALAAAYLMGAGLWTLALPAFKYVFVLAMSLLGLSSSDPKPCDGDNRRARVIAALVLSLLLASLLPACSIPIRKGASGLAVLLLAYSFSSDASFLWRHRRSLSASH